MEMVLNNGFDEMQENELAMVEGGSITVGAVLAGAAAVWVCYEIGYAVGKAIAHAAS